MTETYCLKCKQKTKDVSPKIFKENGRYSRRSKCSTCKSEKRVFVKAPASGSKTATKGGMSVMKLAVIKPAVLSRTPRKMPLKGGKSKTDLATRGGNPAIIQAVAQGAPAVAEAIGDLTKLADNINQRGFEKKQLTGKYEQVADKRTRKTQRQYLKNAQNLVKKYGGVIDDYLPGGKKFFE